MRFYWWNGPQEMLDAMRQREIDRKNHFKIPYDVDTAFLGFECPSSNSTTEKQVWEEIYKTCETKAGEHGMDLL